MIGIRNIGKSFGEEDLKLSRLEKLPEMYSKEVVETKVPKNNTLIDISTFIKSRIPDVAKYLSDCLISIDGTKNLIASGIVGLKSKIEVKYVSFNSK